MIRPYVARSPDRRSNRQTTQSLCSPMVVISTRRPAMTFSAWGPLRPHPFDTSRLRSPTRFSLQV